MASAKPPAAATSKAASHGGFQFVDASDRKSIMRLRNTMVSRKHRDNKVRRIAELEKMLAEREKEVDALRKRAEAAEKRRD